MAGALIVEGVFVDCSVSDEIEDAAEEVDDKVNESGVKGVCRGDRL